MKKIYAERNKEILDHYRRYWGNPKEIFDFDVKRYVSSSDSVFIAEFPPKSVEEDWVYATIGVSGFRGTNGIVNDAYSRNLEFFVYSNLQNMEIAKFLASLSVYPIANKTSFSVGDTVRGDESIVEGSGLSDVLLTYPYFEEKNFSIIHHTDNTHTLMIWIVPIFPSERQFLHKTSWDALEEHFRKNATDTSDFFRKPVV